jgi:hypothetical protein
VSPARQGGLFGERASGPSPETRWHTRAEVEIRAGQGYDHIVRGLDDPERGGAELPEGRGWDKSYGFKGRYKLGRTDPEEWAARIAALLADGRPRTFNHIAVELLDKTADVVIGSPVDEGLRLAFDRGLLELAWCTERDEMGTTHEALYWRRAG